MKWSGNRELMSEQSKPKTRVELDMNNRTRARSGGEAGLRQADRGRRRRDTHGARHLPKQTKQCPRIGVVVRGSRTQDMVGANPEDTERGRCKLYPRTRGVVGTNSEDTGYGRYKLYPRTGGVVGANSI